MDDGIFTPEHTGKNSYLTDSTNVYIDGAHKQTGLIIYEISFDSIQNEYQNEFQNEWGYIEGLYDQLLLRPLHRIDHSSERLHVFVLVWSLVPELDPRLPFCMVEVRNGKL